MDSSTFITNSPNELIGRNKNPKFWESVFSSEKEGEIHFVVNENGLWIDGRIINWSDISHLYFVKEIDVDKEESSNLAIKLKDGELVTLELDKSDKHHAEVMNALRANISNHPEIKDSGLDNIGRSYTAEF